MKQKDQHFAELEYCFGQYFSKYCAPIVVKDFNYYNRKQAEEFRKAYSEVSQTNIGAGSPLQGMIQFQYAKIKAQSSGKWSKKNIDDFINGVSGKIISNKQFVADWNRLIDEYRTALISRIGERGYYNAAVALRERLGEKQLVDPALHYGQMRFVQLLKEQLARTTMPKSSVEYVLKEAISNNSLFGMIALRAGRGRGLSDTEEELQELEKKFYKPSGKEKAAAWVTGAAVDVAATAGAGSLVSAGKTLAVNTAFNAGGTHIEKGANYVMGWFGLNGANTGQVSQKEYSKIVFGNAETLGKYQKGAWGFRRNGTEYISNVNDSLGKKIKVAPLRPHVSNAAAKKEANQLMVMAKGNSGRLLKSISAIMDKQDIPYNSKAPIPGWMLHKTSRQCRAFASSFFSIAKQMSVQGLSIWNVSGKNMTLVQVAQRANDYARAAVLIDKVNAEKQAARAAAYRRNHQESRQETASHAKSHHDAVASPSIGHFPSQAVSGATVSSAQPSAQVQAPQNSSITDDSSYSNMPQMAGWGKYLDNAGLNGFGDVAKNLGYVFAMLPDMLIGMFTGKTSSFTIGNNILPLAAITAGLFSKNPLLKLMLMGFGGLNILNNAGHEVLGLSTSRNVASKNYKQYADEPLNPRLNNVAMRGRSLIADIDNKPVVINISDNAVDAYEKKAEPLNTLANAVLRKYDESMVTASSSYDRNIATLEDQNQQRGYGLK